ncbi:hypothetical protein MBM_06288 [Drepanopeziza brunnea f. sp. 'multigermtubi' MB_m1]|uniref:Uncharacterized protein n=1 Tax=Marssonina brunnea f. sp. multigermtubi (strain MB_m1) TaxID=1072389 RepID=K1WE57_MARBU|nr:uncharacterized protein MBM_06288 [Drepanopeziza brunnea f. sp. 'multigermtubi' MB_m1]EKD15660.1 hypothetical protein MBM_06288 [Drepanopeziza brunnea f. sp. 'multigermtubi' MB_m1]
MQLQSKSICAFLLALSFAQSFASGLSWDSFLNRAQGLFGGRQIIGYRTVSKLEADMVNFRNRPFRDRAFDLNGRFQQLGHGLYLSNEAGLWNGRPGSWYCAIKANKKKIAKANKIYIPEYYEHTTEDGEIENTHLWVGREDEILEYLESRVKDPKKALRFSYTLYEGWSMQMLIPTDMVNNNDEFDLWAKCFETKRELFKYSSATIDWKSWNIVGDPGKPF